jgi:chromate transporter
VWVTFVPCFIWIFAGAPYVERARSSKVLSAALSAITAAVVGCVLNLSIWFTLHVLFAHSETYHFALIPGWFQARLLWPDARTIQLDALLVTLFACILLFWLKRGLLTTLAGSVALGATLWLLRPV